MNTIIYSSGVDKCNSEEFYPSVKFTKIYQTYNHYMGVNISMKFLPRPFTEFSGPGTPPEYIDSIGVGSFNLDANPTTDWFSSWKGHQYRRGFEVITPRPDLGKNKNYHDRIVWQTYEQENHNIDLCEVIPTELAIERLETLSKEYFQPFYDIKVMEIREQKQRERIDALTKYKRNIPVWLKTMKARIKLGTSIPEDWERIN